MCLCVTCFCLKYTSFCFFSPATDPCSQHSSRNPPFLLLSVLKTCMGFKTWPSCRLPMSILGYSDLIKSPPDYSLVQFVGHLSPCLLGRQRICTMIGDGDEKKKTYRPKSSQPGITPETHILPMFSWKHVFPPPPLSNMGSYSPVHPGLQPAFCN